MGIDNAILTARTVLEERGLDHLPVTDMIVETLETAIYAATSSQSAIDAAIAARDLMPNRRGDFEKGVAYGMAFLLAPIPPGCRSFGLLPLP